MAQCRRWVLLALAILLAVPVHAQWTRTFHADFSRDFAVIGSLVFAGTGSGVAMLTDSGAHWSKTTLNGRYINALIAKGDTLFAAMQNTVYLSADSGTTWTLITNGLPPNVYVDVLATDGSLVFAGTAAHGLYLTSDNGAQWTHAEIPLVLENVADILVDGPRIFIGTGDGVFRSTDRGQTWTAANTGLPGSVNAFALHNSVLFASSSYLGKVFLSRDSGEHWATACSLSTVFDITCWGSTLVMGTTGYGVYLSDDDGASVHPINEGLAEGNIWTVAVIGGYLFAGGPGVWRRPLTELPTDVHGFASDVPRALHVVQNYPNPFNAATTITFSLTGTEVVSLSVYDMLGREVARVFQGAVPAGRHAFVWTPGQIPSGLYFYRLAFRGTTLTGTALLLK